MKVIDKALEKFERRLAEKVTNKYKELINEMNKSFATLDKALEELEDRFGKIDLINVINDSFNRILDKTLAHAQDLEEYGKIYIKQLNKQIEDNPETINKLIKSEKVELNSLPLNQDLTTKGTIRKIAKPGELNLQNQQLIPKKIYINTHDRRHRRHFDNINPIELKSEAVDLDIVFPLEGDIQTSKRRKSILNSEFGDSEGDNNGEMKYLKCETEDGERFGCIKCSAMFTRKTTLDRHTRSTHQGRRDYRCPECGLTYTQSGSLNHHFRTKH